MSEPEVFTDDDRPAIIRGTTSGADCAACPFSKAGEPNRPVVGEGSERPIWIIVGESPGHNEVEQGRPFIGSSGRLVNDALARIRVQRESIYITNATLCAPTPGATDAMKVQARTACAPRLQRELAQFPGRPIAALGAIAAQGFCGNRFSITQMAGAYHEVDIGEWPWKPIEGPRPEPNGHDPDIRCIIPSIHPAAILRGGSGGGGGGSHTVDLAFWNLVYDLQKVNLLARGAGIRFRDDIDIEVENPRRAEALVAGFLDEARRAGRVAIDTETYVDDPKKHSALSPVTAKLKAIGLATEVRAISVAWGILTPRAKWLLRVITSDPKISKTFHNSAYDTVVLKRHGFPMEGPIEDTLLMHHAAFPGLAHNLQRVATQFFAISPWKAEFRAGEGTDEELLKYNCLMAGTPVFLADGTTALIESLVRRRRKVRVATLLPDGSIGTRRVINWHQTKVEGQRWICIRTAANSRGDRGLVLTPDHEVYLRRGKTRADATHVGDEIALPEIAFSPDQMQAVIGTLLGDSRLNLMPSYRPRPYMSPSAALSGGHESSSGLAAWKVACLSPHAILDPPRSHRTGYKPHSLFQPFRTRELHQLVEFLPLFYAEDGRCVRHIPTGILDCLGDIGIAWWFMDDGCRQLMPNLERDTICLALCRYPREDVERTRQWMERRFGRIYCGKDKVLRFSQDATRAFCQSVAKYIYAGVSYKLPRWYDGPLSVVPKPSGRKPVYARIVSVSEYSVGSDRSSRCRARWRYCLTVEETHNFFTSFGLVANCRDALSTARLYAPLAIAVRRSNAEQVYEIDMAMAKAAALMHEVGVPISREVNAQLRAGFQTNIEKARQEIVAKAFDPATFDRLEARLAFEQARRIRKGDPVDLDQRLALRLAEMRRKPFQFQIDSGDHVVAFLKSRGVPLNLQTRTGRISTKKDILESFAQFPEVRALLAYRENAKLLSTYVERLFDRHYPNGKVVYGFADEHDRVHPRWSVHKITGRWGSEAPVCFDGETEILTERGWLRFDELPEEVRVAQCWLGRREVDFVLPTQRVKYHYEGAMVALRGDGIDLLVTPDHRFPVLREPVGWEIVHAHEWDSRLHALITCDDSKTPRFGTARADYCMVGWRGNVYCVSVPSSFIIVRRGLQPVVAGNCQNWPKADKKKGRPNLRSQVVAPKGRALVGFDFAQLEARLIALLSGDPFLIDIFKNKKDIHSEFARIVWPDFDRRPVDERKVLRDMVKRPEYCLAPDTLITMADGSLRPACEIRPGDRLLAFTAPDDPSPWWQGDLFQYATVELVAPLTLPCRHVVTNRGEFTASIDHLCVIDHLDGVRSWRRVDQLQKGDVLLFYVGNERMEAAHVLATRPCGFHDVIAIKTTTNTLLGNGFFHHNCAFYGGAVETGWKSVVRDYPNVTLQMIGKMVAMMKTKMPGVTAWHERMMRMADQEGEVRSVIFSRRRAFPLKQFDPSEAINFPVQSSAADLMNRGLMTILPRLPPSTFPILQIHDAAVFECDEDDAEKIKDLVVTCFTQEVEYEGVTLEFPVDAKIGKSWAEV